jgi:hypothetical protein
MDCVYRALDTTIDATELGSVKCGWKWTQQNGSKCGVLHKLMFTRWRISFAN